MKRKAEERAKRAEEKAKNIVSKGKRPVRKGALPKPKQSVASSSDTPSTSGVPALKKRRLQDSEEIDVNECCMCFGNYVDDIIEGAGAEWISCACGRWLHEDCIENQVIDTSGRERFCPFCVC